jgi:hypothetical protein
VEVIVGHPAAGVPGRRVSRDLVRQPRERIHAVDVEAEAEALLVLVGPETPIEGTPGSGSAVTTAMSSLVVPRASETGPLKAV